MQTWTRILKIAATRILLLIIAVGVFDLALHIDSRPSVVKVTIENPVVSVQDTPEQTMLKAIDLMKPGAHGTTTQAASLLAQQLQDQGYYYWTTYQDGTERINHESGDTATVEDDVEFTITNTGMVLGADSYGVNTQSWGVFCSASPSARSTIASLNALLNETQHAASARGANTACAYDQLGM